MGPGVNHELDLLHILVSAHRHTSFRWLGLVALVAQEPFPAQRLAQRLRDDWACGRFCERSYVLLLAFLATPRWRNPAHLAIQRHFRRLCRLSGFAEPGWSDRWKGRGTNSDCRMRLAGLHELGPNCDSLKRKCFPR